MELTSCMSSKPWTWRIECEGFLTGVSVRSALRMLIADLHRRKRAGIAADGQQASIRVWHGCNGSGSPPASARGSPRRLAPTMDVAPMLNRKQFSQKPNVTAWKRYAPCHHATTCQIRNARSRLSSPPGFQARPTQRDHNVEFAPPPRSARQDRHAPSRLPGGGRDLCSTSPGGALPDEPDRSRDGVPGPVVRRCMETAHGRGGAGQGGHARSEKP